VPHKASSSQLCLIDGRRITPLSCYNIIMNWIAQADQCFLNGVILLGRRWFDHLPHNLKVVGFNPTPATRKNPLYQIDMAGFSFCQSRHEILCPHCVRKTHGDEWPVLSWCASHAGSHRAAGGRCLMDMVRPAAQAAEKIPNEATGGANATGFEPSTFRCRKDRRAFLVPSGRRTALGSNRVFFEINGVRR
jgi:hypothetical protein